MVTFGKHMDGSSDRHTYFSIEVFELEFSQANSGPLYHEKTCPAQNAQNASKPF